MSWATRFSQLNTIAHDHHQAPDNHSGSRPHCIYGTLNVCSLLALRGNCFWGQVAVDQAAFLLDLAATNGSWDDVREQLATFYKEAGLEEMSRFVATVD
jgi:hypothetical protein